MKTCLASVKFASADTASRDAESCPPWGGNVDLTNGQEWGTQVGRRSRGSADGSG